VSLSAGEVLVLRRQPTFGLEHPNDHASSSGKYILRLACPSRIQFPGVPHSLIERPLCDSPGQGNDDDVVSEVDNRCLITAVDLIGVHGASVVRVLPADKIRKPRVCIDQGRFDLISGSLVKSVSMNYMRYLKSRGANLAYPA
jgi:hypothetical protein